MKPKNHFMGSVIGRSKALSSGEEIKTNKIDMLILTVYMKEQALMFLRR